MRAIKLVQFGSTIAILVFLLYVLVMGCLILLRKVPGSMAELMEQCMMYALFVGPEKLAAFFGPAWKRKQNGQPQENNR